MLVALDQELTQDTELHCMGGFVLTEHYGLVRATGDVDVLESAGTDKATIARLAGRGSPLHKRHRVYIDIVTVADVPDDYDTRLETMDIEGLTRLRLKVLERHDLVLAKLCRNIDRDREDVMSACPSPWSRHRRPAAAVPRGTAAEARATRARRSHPAALD
jgi:hypothetical protein